MREEDSNCFSKWEDHHDELPPPDELMPLSQTLITPDLASAFDIGTSDNGGGYLTPPQTGPPRPNSAEFDSSSAEAGGLGGPDEPARTLKRPRLVWTPQLHKRFVDAVAHLGIKNAVPKTIMQLMSVDGLTRENVASHLQKYRLYLKRMQGLNNGPAGGLSGPSDSSTDRLFASSSVPAHFLPVAALQHQQIQAQYPYHRQMAQFGPAQGGGQFEHPYLTRQAQLGPNRNGGMMQSSGRVENVESAAANNGRKVLTLFPTGDD